MAEVVKVITTLGAVIHKAVGFTIDPENGYLYITGPKGGTIAVHAPHDWLWAAEGTEEEIT